MKFIYFMCIYMHIFIEKEICIFHWIPYLVYIYMHKKSNY
jgi:hypothetical protein